MEQSLEEGVIKRKERLGMSLAEIGDAVDDFQKANAELGLEMSVKLKEIVSEQQMEEYAGGCKKRLWTRETRSSRKRSKNGSVRG